MDRRPNRNSLFNAERWRARRDLRADIAYVVMAVAILAGISALDTGNPRTTASGAVAAARVAP